MFQAVYIAIALAGLTFCGLWDLLTSNISGKICSVMIILGVGLHLIESYMIGSYNPILYSVVVGGLFSLFALFMYYTGQWGDGDAIMLSAVGFLIPTASAPILFPFSVSYFMNFVFINLFFSLGYFLYLTKNPKVTRKGMEFYRKIPASKLKVDDALAEDIPRLKLYKKKIRGLKANEVEKIKKIKRYVKVREGIRSGIVFPMALVFTLYIGDFMSLFI